MLLTTVNNPQDLKTCSLPQLYMLASEIRQFLVETLSKTGGHLAPNLGVVELTLALHYVFNSPEDKLIWDVGHQAYVHKILTGRRELFPTLRQYKGLCGFPKMSESPHDVWETGHSSTSLSAAMGMATARDLKKEKHHVVAIIGDGALTGGMAFEALNHIGHEKKNVIVVLNDNEMSIAPNVGALHNYLGKLRSAENYRNAKKELEHLLKSIPAVGGRLAHLAERFKDSLKYLLVSGVLFEELGFTYIGPIDGHNLELLLDSLKTAKQTRGPVLIHAITKKGKGYAPAEADSVKWHGIGTYKIESGHTPKSAPTYTSVFADTMIQLAEADERIVAVTPAMPAGSGLLKFGERFPDRLFDVGIAEQHACTFAAGLATQGLKPVYAVYSTFLQRAYDQLIHDVARQKLNVIFAVDRAGLVGADGETHQGMYDIAFMRTIPNMVIMAPKDENELRHMMKTAVAYEDGPISFRYPRLAIRGVKMDEELQVLPIGKAEVVREGKNVAILSFGHVFELAEAAVEQLDSEGIQPMLVNARFCKPLDEELLFRLAREGYDIVTVEEGAAMGGFGSAVLECLAAAGFHQVRVEVVAVPDYFVEHGSVKEQREEVGLTADAIAARVRALLPMTRGVVEA
ncbi:MULTISPECIES: 1-deoxy-D-xylulose-5-phosphate synthase [Bacillales]|jgi:1-deoxy-D-xylulose-5-phosphate synthase|uniref:1-deoxy-D-xylulose-5-phosphate synthase n=1 Tax=Brevibacillus TaxID=55080 RepID=UPI000E374A19|nr:MULTISPECIES: 1-deoxy-D-xylulose-5-phosphate synthase [Bacillales]REK62343.1 MAG: 1-deoxy-D-xylulose-5-phosphate synthase [Brevibacillus sp.]MBR8659220.1 1-deoxy-D-xylulose-5-phosphate synthase [Brevibacillus sp. NL20B1]MDT3415250.1 1-deoxy-D-xylulose-5-phosphate synthase [Brevibacillus aydinogluensis]NNV02736.1 1-deoxy-D-xylulose-5-phosphate synthase [Brevibacillus sp. MCWH]UFJ60351.1 1-deoxy-D-xylulose-5-phosphate synthase [Anoxybacillus sediminis]